MSNETPFANPSDAEIRQLLIDSKSIALVGASVDPARPSHQVMHYLQTQNYAVSPVNPAIKGQKLLGETVSDRLAAINKPIDIINIFRNPDTAGDIIDEAIVTQDQSHSKIVWLQLGVINAGAAARAKAAGFIVIMDRCIKIEHQRLIPH